MSDESHRPGTTDDRVLYVMSGLVGGTILTALFLVFTAEFLPSGLFDLSAAAWIVGTVLSNVVWMGYSLRTTDTADDTEETA